MNRMVLNVGDWSDDGHGKYEKVVVAVNKTVEEVRAAYEQSCTLTGVRFDNNTEANYQLFVEYEDGTLPQEAEKVFTA